MDALYLDRGEGFLVRECCRRESTVVAALLGGSQIYRDSGSGKSSERILRPHRTIRINNNPAYSRLPGYVIY